MQRPPSEPTIPDYDAIVADILARDEDLARERGQTLDEYLAEQDAQRQAAERRATRIDVLERRVRNLAPIESRLSGVVHQALVRGEKLQATMALREVHAWLTTPNAAPFLVLTGNPRTGKTVAAAYGLARHEHADYVHAHQLAERVRPWHADLERGVVPVRLDVEYLVVDDLGTERASDRVLEATYVLVDERRGYVRPRGKRVRPKTLITSNLARPMLLDHLDKRVAMRLEEDAVWVTADEAPVPVWRRS